MLCHFNYKKEGGEVIKKYTLQERANFYNETCERFAKHAPLVANDRWLYGMWMMGQWWKGSGYYGAYPPSFLERTMSLFPDAKSILHLFSGSLTEEVKGDRLDLNPEFKPEIIGDAHQLSSVVSKNYDLIIADPPYSSEDANNYGKPMINRNKVVKECYKVLEPGGYLVWLDQILPMYRKDEVTLVGTIGVIRSTNHRVRAVFIFCKT